MSTETLVPEIGQIVAVRQRLYLVDHVIPPPNPSDSFLLRLSCVDDDAQGQPLDVLWDRELDTQVVTGEAWDAIAKRGFDPAGRRRPDSSSTRRQCRRVYLANCRSAATFDAKGARNRCTWIASNPAVANCQISRCGAWPPPRELQR